MTEPTLHLLPLRHGAPRSGGTLPFTLRIVPPQPDGVATRPRLNLALVIDRSGSMSGAPLEHAKRAAATVVSALRPDDRVAVVVYDDAVRVLIPSSPANDPSGMRHAIASVQAGGSTALHAGWVEGGTQVGQHLDSQAINRVILLSDGQANVGLREPNAIGDHTAGLAERGITTTTLGLGRSFNEDLLLTMAERGAGSYYYVESPNDLARIFAEELDGLTATFGVEVRLAFRSGVDARIGRLLNDLPESEGGWSLPDLIAGVPVDLGAELSVPPLQGDAALLGELVLSWRPPGQGERLERSVALSLPLLDDAAYRALPEDAEVRVLLAELEAAALKDRAVAALDRGDRAAVGQLLFDATALLQAAPASPATEQAMADLELLEASLEAGDDAVTRKQMVTQAYRTKRSKKG